MSYGRVPSASTALLPAFLLHELTKLVDPVCWIALIQRKPRPAWQIGTTLTGEP